MMTAAATSSVLDAAIRYAARGWPVFPCKPRGKEPLTGNGFKDATTDRAAVLEWWKRWPDANVAIHCRDWVVLDVDPRNDGAASLEALFSTRADKHGFETLEAETGGGGRHYIFRNPGFSVTAKELAPGLDLKAAGGYIIVAPSVHPSGRLYAWIDEDVEPSDIPEWLADVIREKQRERGKPFIVPSEILDGERNNTLFRLASSLWSKGLGEIEIRASLEAVNKERCSPPLPASELSGIVASVLRYPPGPSPRAFVEVSDRADASAGIDRTTRYMWNDTGNANRLVDAHGDNLLYCEKRDSFLAWDGRRWILDRSIHVSRLAESVMLAAFGEASQYADDKKRGEFLRFLNASLKRSGIENMVAVSKRKLQTVEPGEFDGDASLLNFDNGTLDLRTGLLRDHRRDDLITKLIPYAFDPAAKAPTFHRFLERIMGGGPDASPGDLERADRLILFLQRALGFAITGEPGKVLFILWGEGNNGKTTLLETIRAALGGKEYAGQLQIESLMANQREAAGNNAINADLADLQGCRFVVASEPEKGMKFSLSRVKHLTGLGEVKARYLRENHFIFKPSHKLFIDTNHKPIISDPTDAIWNRVKLVPFTVTIPPHEIDPTLPEKLRAELPGIMAWLAAGAMDYQREGLTDPPEVRDATEVYRCESDRLREFVEDACIVRPRAWVAVSDLWTAYQRWEDSNGVRFPLKKSEFEDRIARLGCKKTRRENGTIRAWDGIGLAMEVTK